MEGGYSGLVAVPGGKIQSLVPNLVLVTSAQLEHTLFFCATERGHSALHAWTKITRTVPWDAFSTAERRLLPAVWKNLSSQFSEFPGRAQLANLYRYTWGRNFRLQHGAEGVIALLREAGIETLVLKGLALNATIYTDMGTRPAYDFDLLVPFAKAQDAIAVLLRDGWQFEADEPAPNPALRLGQAGPMQKGDLEFDLHWFALREARDPKWDEVLWQNAVEITLGNTRCRTLCPQHQFFHLLVNAGREPENRYRYLLDLFHFVGKYGSEIDPGVVKQMLRERRLLHRLSYVPLEEIGWQHLRQGTTPGPLDCLWSWCSRYVHDGTGELLFGVFPFVDYWLHYAGRPDIDLSLSQYLQHHLQLEGWNDFFKRLWGKLRRSLQKPP